jgi:hypothetical protein
MSTGVNAYVRIFVYTYQADGILQQYQTPLWPYETHFWAQTTVSYYAIMAVEIVMLEKLEYSISESYKANIYESASTAECHQPVSESTVISGNTRHHHLRPYKALLSLARQDTYAAATTEISARAI